MLCSYDDCTDGKQEGLKRKDCWECLSTPASHPPVWSWVAAKGDRCCCCYSNPIGDQSFFTTPITIHALFCTKNTYVRHTHTKQLLILPFHAERMMFASPGAIQSKHLFHIVWLPLYWYQYYCGFTHSQDCHIARLALPVGDEMRGLRTWWRLTHQDLSIIEVVH